MKDRNDDPGYKEWKAAVLKRDRNKCQMPNCRRKKNLEVHHIIRYADSVYVRYEVDNGITLCKRCHYQIRNNESHFVSLFMEIVRSKR